jgi:hypothetical protein
LGGLIAIGSYDTMAPNKPLFILNNWSKIMMTIALDQILALVGKLDDAPGEDVPRERFRRFLQENINEVGQVR